MGSNAAARGHEPSRSTVWRSTLRSRTESARIRPDEGGAWMPRPR